MIGAGFFFVLFSLFLSVESVQLAREGTSVYLARYFAVLCDDVVSVMELSSSVL